MSENVFGRLKRRKKVQIGEDPRHVDLGSQRFRSLLPSQLLMMNGKTFAEFQFFSTFKLSLLRRASSSASMGFEGIEIHEFVAEPVLLL